MTREQACIKELYELVDRITENARKHDLSLLRSPRGASGCDMYQGLPPICRIRDDILNRYEDISTPTSRIRAAVAVRWA